MIQDQLAQQLAIDLPDVWTYRPDTAGGNVFVEHMPDSPDTCCAFMDGASAPPAQQTYGWDTVGVQVIVRAAGHDPSVAHQLAEGIRRNFAGRTGWTLPDGSQVVGATALQSAPVSMSRDEAGRYEYAVNLQVEVGQATAHRPLT